MNHKQKDMNQKLFLRVAICLALIPLLFACDKNNDVPVQIAQMRLTITPQREVHVYHHGAGDEQAECYVAQNEAGETLYIKSIEGFDGLYRKGFVYVADVQKTTYAPRKPVMDGEAYDRYRLVKLVSAKKKE